MIICYSVLSGGSPRNSTKIYINKSKKKVNQTTIICYLFLVSVFKVKSHVAYSAGYSTRIIALANHIRNIRDNSSNRRQCQSQSNKGIKCPVRYDRRRGFSTIRPPHIPYSSQRPNFAKTKRCLNTARQSALSYTLKQTTQVRSSTDSTFLPYIPSIKGQGTSKRAYFLR